MNLAFKLVDLAEHSGVCLRFEADMEKCSYEGDGSLDEERGAAFLRKIAEGEALCLHVWLGEEIVGQLHLGRVANEPVGYIHFFYVAPNFRGLGAANLLDDYAAAHFIGRGFRSARLSVMIANRRAVRFYRRQGWRDGAARADKPGAMHMNKALE